MYGAEGSRTPGLCSAIAALSQLSYSPATERAKPSQSPGRTPVLTTRPRSRGAGTLNETYPYLTGSQPATTSTTPRRRTTSGPVTAFVTGAYLPGPNSAPPSGCAGCSPDGRGLYAGTSRLIVTARSRSWNFCAATPLPCATCRRARPRASPPARPIVSMCSRSRLTTSPPFRPALRASSADHSCAVPFACAALPPLLAISRCRAGSIEANPLLLFPLIGPPTGNEVGVDAAVIAPRSLVR